MVSKVNQTYKAAYDALMDRLWNQEETLSFSSISQFCLSPKHFIDYKMKKRKTTAVMRRGSLTDCLITDADRFKEKYQIAEGGFPTTELQQKYCDLVIKGESKEDAYSKVYTNKGQKVDHLDTYINYKQGKDNREPITQKQYDLARMKADAILRNDAAREVLDEITDTQKAVNWEFCGYNWRGYIDFFGDNAIADLKDWQSAKPRKVEWIIRDKRTDQQLSAYNFATGLTRNCFVIAIEAGGHISVTEITPESQMVALEKLERTMAKFKYCLSEDLWHMSYDFWIDGGIYKF